MGVIFISTWWFLPWCRHWFIHLYLERHKWTKRNLSEASQRGEGWKHVQQLHHAPAFLLIWTQTTASSLNQELMALPTFQKCVPYLRVFWSNICCVWNAAFWTFTPQKHWRRSNTWGLTLETQFFVLEDIDEWERWFRLWMMTCGYTRNIENEGNMCCHLKVGIFGPFSMFS